MPVPDKQYKIDFGSKTGGESWEVVNDGVMGGLSEGQLFLKENSILFKGTLSLENNGGFSTFRSPMGSYDLSRYSTVSIRYKCSERNFEMTLATSRYFFRTNYKYAFTKKYGEWDEVTFNLTDFSAYRMGNALNERIPATKLDDIIRIGFILSDKKQGAFELEIDYILFE